MSVYDEIEFEDMEFDDDLQMYAYPCPCGDQFLISLEELHEGTDIATCPSCSLMLRVIFVQDDLPPLESIKESSASAVCA